MRMEAGERGWRPGNEDGGQGMRMEAGEAGERGWRLGNKDGDIEQGSDLLAMRTKVWEQG